MTTNFTQRTAEFCLPGHPDKLADAIADAIVQEARRRQKRALVAIEVALHRDVVFIDGCVKCRGAKKIDFEKLTREVFASAGFCGRFGARLPRLKIISDLSLKRLSRADSACREFSDDQSIVTGYACSLPGTDGLPIEHALARRLALALDSLRCKQPALQLGPDGKVIVFLDESQDTRSLRLADVSLSIQHAKCWDAVAAHRAIDARLRSEVQAFVLAVPGFDATGEYTLQINPAGDFVKGGPHGDNGLSGKKLVCDFYGPRVAIGGGAMSGKDFWKADRVGPIIARNLALAAVERLGCRECTVTLGIRPGDSAFRVVRVEAENRQPINTARLSGLVDLRLTSLENWPEAAGDIVALARWGHFAPTPAVVPIHTRTWLISEQKTATINRIVKAISSGLSLSEACANEDCKVTTFFARMRKHGPDGTGGVGYPRSIRQKIVLDEYSAYANGGNCGSSWRATIRYQLLARFDPMCGLQLTRRCSNTHIWLSDDGCTEYEDIGESLRSISEIVETLQQMKTWNSDVGPYAFDVEKSIRALKHAFPWLPESVEELKPSTPSA